MDSKEVESSESKLDYYIGYASQLEDELAKTRENHDLIISRLVQERDYSKYKLAQAREEEEDTEK
ncbi:hypothetical protein DFH07DRAFT_924371, partial [Mycena maculata]